MRRATWLTASLIWMCGAPAAAHLRVAAFRADATPPPGEPLIWVTPVERVADPLWAKGLVLEDRGARYVLCAIDWCGIGGSTHRALRERMGAAAGTEAARVALHAVHQHTAPYIDGDGYRLLAKRPNPPLLMSERYLDELAGKLAAAVRDAVARLEPFDHIGVSQTRVEQVASARRLWSAEAKPLTRYSTGGKDPAMAALPEGPVDPQLRTITLARGARPVVRLHYYATHPQTFCCDGTVSGDFVSAAREAVERETGVPQIYFTGAAGDVTVGKYNDGSPRARQELAGRLRQALGQANRAVPLRAATRIGWRVEPFHLPRRATQVQTEPYRAAIAEAFAARTEPLEAVLVTIGPARILHLPGEPMLEFQNYARSLRPKEFVVLAGYGDISPGYLCTDKAYTEGGYEPSAANAGPGVEARVKEAIRRLLDVQDRKP
jgi:hypothetical protein